MAAPIFQRPRFDFVEAGGEAADWSAVEGFGPDIPCLS